MSRPFDSFVIFAEMRTGSNFLESNINMFPGLTCHGEAFNPHFVGYPNRDDLFGITLQQRTEDPLALLAAMREQTAGIGGFRFFHDHDPRALDAVLEDRRCAKIILTRNPLDSYVSWKIAKATGQWKLTDVRRRRDSKVDFDGPEFVEHVARLQEFQVILMNRLQQSGQTAFYVAYEDLHNLDMMNGLARYLGETHELEELDGKLKRQNPSPVSEKVANPEMIAPALNMLDRFNLSRTPNFEPRRGAMVPSYVASSDMSLLFLPVPGAPRRAVIDWMAAQGGSEPEELPQSFNQRTLRKWKRAHIGHRSFTVLRHPVARIHEVFCAKILDDGPNNFARIRRKLRNAHGLGIPESLPDAGYDLAAHRTAFLGFLDFVQASLAGQTVFRQDGHWASQANLLRGFAELAPADVVLREDELAEQLPAFAARLGNRVTGAPKLEEPHGPFALAEVYDDEIEARVAEIYQRDYVAFGFGRWADLR